MATRGNLVAIGTLYESIGKAMQTGMVQVAKLTPGKKPKVKKVYNPPRTAQAFLAPTAPEIIGVRKRHWPQPPPVPTQLGRSVRA